jgi:hypothetical protein
VGSQSSTVTSTSSGQVGLNVTKAITDPTESTSQELTYIYDFTFVDLNISNLDFSTLDLQLVGTSNSVYHSTGGGAGQVLAIDVFQPIIMNPRQQVSGQVAFAVPRTDKPSKLEFVGGSIDFSVSFSVGVPAPTANVSWIKQFNSNLTGSGSTEVNLESITPENFTAPATLGFYSSGEVIALQLSFLYLPSYFGNSTFEVTSIIDSAGFKVVGISPALPVSVGSSGANVMLYLLAPATSFNGTLTIIANVN